MIFILIFDYIHHKYIIFIIYSSSLLYCWYNTYHSSFMRHLNIINCLHYNYWLDVYSSLQSSLFNIIIIFDTKTNIFYTVFIHHLHIINHNIIHHHYSFLHHHHHHHHQHHHVINDIYIHYIGKRREGRSWSSTVATKNSRRWIQIKNN